MKQIWQLISLITLIIISGNCDKITDNDSDNLNDSITLKYIDLNPDTTFINPLINDTVRISVETWTDYSGPHPYTNERVWIKSNNPEEIMISFGKIQGYKLCSLDKDSVIDESLEWYENYVSGGYILGSIGYRSNYVGVRIIGNGKTYYGWIHTPTCYKMTEYAIDTSDFTSRKVLAGRLKK